MKALRPAAWTFVLSIAFVPAARADLPPPDGYVEKCTVAKKEQPGTQCESCSAYHGDPDACKTKYAGTKFAYVCQAWGASVWDEVWCDGPPRVENEDAEGTGCSYALPGAKGASGAAFSAGVAALAIAALRRRRTRG